MTEFIYKNDKYFIDGVEVREMSVLAILNKAQIIKLRETGKVRMRTSNIDKKLNNKSSVKLSKEEKLLNKVKDNYKTDTATYIKTGFVYELYRKHKFGFWQIVCYLDDLNQETIDKAILKDIKEQQEINRNKKKLK